MRIRFPWFTLYAEPNGAPRWRVACAMLAHEALELVCGSEVAHANRWARRYAIGAPDTYPLPGQRGSQFVIAMGDSLPTVVDGAILYVTNGTSSGHGASGAVINVPTGYVPVAAITLTTSP